MENKDKAAFKTLSEGYSNSKEIQNLILANKPPGIPDEKYLEQWIEAFKIKAKKLYKEVENLKVKKRSAFLSGGFHTHGRIADGNEPIINPIKRRPSEYGFYVPDMGPGFPGTIVVSTDDLESVLEDVRDETFKDRFIKAILKSRP